MSIHVNQVLPIGELNLQMSEELFNLNPLQMFYRYCLVSGQQRAAQQSQHFSGVGIAACRQSQCGGGDRPDYSYSSSSCKSFASAQKK